MKKTLLAATLMAAAGLMLTSCATGAEPTPTESPSNSPMATESMQPSPTESAMPMDPAGMTAEDGMGLVPDESMAPAAEGVTTAEDARRTVEQIEEELERLSEIDSAQVVIVGNTAAVALEFDDQYQGGLDDRLREIVRERVNGVISGVNVIEITDDMGLMDELEKLGDSLEGAADMDKLRTELDAIIQRITGKNPA